MVHDRGEVLRGRGHPDRLLTECGVLGPVGPDGHGKARWRTSRSVRSRASRARRPASTLRAVRRPSVFALSRRSSAPRSLGPGAPTLGSPVPGALTLRSFAPGALPLGPVAPGALAAGLGLAVGLPLRAVPRREHDSPKDAVEARRLEGHRASVVVTRCGCLGRGRCGGGHGCREADDGCGSRVREGSVQGVKSWSLHDHTVTE